MKILESFMDRISESFRTAPGDPIDFFNYVSRQEPELEDMKDEQVDLLVEILEAMQVYLDKYGQDGQSSAENELGVSFQDMFRRYRYRPDPQLDSEGLDAEGEDFYEWLVVRYEKS